MIKGDPLVRHRQTTHKHTQTEASQQLVYNDVFLLVLTIKYRNKKRSAPHVALSAATSPFVPPHVTRKKEVPFMKQDACNTRQQQTRDTRVWDAPAVHPDRSDGRAIVRFTRLLSVSAGDWHQQSGPTSFTTTFLPHSLVPVSAS